MKKLAVCGCILAAGLIAALFIHLHAKEKAMEEETGAFVSDTVTAISKAWDAAELVKRAEPGLVKAMASQQGQSVSGLFAVYSKLGHLLDDPDCKFKDTAEFSAYTTASFSCEAQYDNGPATVLITLRRKEGEDDWKIYYINISSPFFTDAGFQRTK